MRFRQRVILRRSSQRCNKSIHRVGRRDEAFLWLKGMRSSDTGWQGSMATLPQCLNVWESALAAPPWNGPPVWHHGDLDMRNWIVRNKRITGVIDWDMMGVGDPACDVMVAWKLHSPAARDASGKLFLRTMLHGREPAAGSYRRRWQCWLTIRPKTIRFCTVRPNPGSI